MRQDERSMRGGAAAELPRRGRPLPGLARRTRVWPLMVAVLVSVSSAGCSVSTTVRALCGPYEECKRREALKMGAAMEARRIWRECYAERYQAYPRDSDFQQGFFTAFVETALGGTGCPPPIPTRPLLSLNTLTHSFPDANAWYAGYHLGHASALANGVDRRRLAPINPELLANACPCPSGMGMVEQAGRVIEAGELLESAEPVDPPLGLPEGDFDDRASESIDWPDSPSRESIPAPLNLE